MKVFKFKVRGKMRFPLDMLRYDQCWPATSLDIEHLDESLGNTSWGLGSESGQPIEVELLHAQGTGATWTPSDRWASFGWEVVDVRRWL